jgi:phosphinothricin acetyltransferase
MVRDRLPGFRHEALPRIRVVDTPAGEGGGHSMRWCGVDMRPHIRAAEAGDADAIARIFGYYVTTSVITFAEVAPSSDAWMARIAQGLPFLVADIGAQIAGFASTSQWRPQLGYRHTLEHGVYVAPEHTGRGVGTALLQCLVADATEAGYEQMVAVIAIAPGLGDASVRLHRRCGFRDVGVLESVGAKHGRRIDTRLMQLSLVNPQDQGR